MPNEIYDISEDNNEISCNSSSSSEIGNIVTDLSKFTVQTYQLAPEKLNQTINSQCKQNPM